MRAGSFTIASSFIRPWQLGQASTSTAKVRARNSAHARYPLARSGFEGSSLAAGASGGWLRREVRPPRARRCQHARVAHRVQAR
jgi:hypothetical protein